MADTKAKSDAPSSSPENSFRSDHYDEKTDNKIDTDVLPRNKLSTMFENPLGGIPREQLFKDVDEFCQKWDLMEYQNVFRKGALVAQSPHAVQGMDDLTDEDKLVIEREHTHKWSQPKTLYWLVSMYIKSRIGSLNAHVFSVMCSMCAAVQGMDETVNNGAQTFYLKVSFNLEMRLVKIQPN